MELAPLLPLAPATSPSAGVSAARATTRRLPARVVQSSYAGPAALASLACLARVAGRRNGAKTPRRASFGPAPMAEEQKQDIQSTQIGARVSYVVLSNMQAILRQLDQYGYSQVRVEKSLEISRLVLFQRFPLLFPFSGHRNFAPGVSAQCRWTAFWAAPRTATQIRSEMR